MAKRGGIRSQASKYYGYARECERQASVAEAAEIRCKLLELARVWMEAARTEEAACRALGRSA